MNSNYPIGDHLVVRIADVIITDIPRHQALCDRCKHTCSVEDESCRLADLLAGTSHTHMCSVCIRELEGLNHV